MAVIKPIKVWTAVEFGRADRTDRFRMHMQNPDAYALTETESKRLDQLRQAFVVMLEYPSRMQAIRVLRETTDWNYVDGSWQYLMRQAGDVFGDYIRINRELDKGIIIERLQTYAKWAEGKGDIELARKCMMDIAKLRHYDRPEAEEDIDTTVPPVYFTTDPAVLEEPADDIEHEEL